MTLFLFLLKRIPNQIFFYYPSSCHCRFLILQLCILSAEYVPFSVTPRTRSNTRRASDVYYPIKTQCEHLQVHPKVVTSA